MRRTGGCVDCWGATITHDTLGIRAFHPPHQKPFMSQSTTPPQESKTNPLCDACAGIQRNWRRAPGHAELMQGVNRKEPRRHGEVTITRYVCEHCGTVWDYENDKTNTHAGWSVVSQPDAAK